MHLSYSEVTGYYTKEEAGGDGGMGKIDESSIVMRQDPYNYMNEKNAILLNCKNPELYNKVYVEAMEKFYKKQRQST